jgi:hypothetical protein
VEHGKTERKEEEDSVCQGRHGGQDKALQLRVVVGRGTGSTASCVTVRVDSYSFLPDMRSGRITYTGSKNVARVSTFISIESDIRTIAPSVFTFCVH